MNCFFVNAPSLANDPGMNCLSAGPSSLDGVEESGYWSATPGSTGAWGLDLHFAEFYDYATTTAGLYVWPVRGGR